jgi:molecular chaperone GrpE
MMSKETEQEKTQGANRPKTANAGGPLRAQADVPQVPVELADDGEEVVVLVEEAEPDVEALAAKAAELERERDELFDKLVRLKAEFENYRKRMLREQTRILETAESEMVKKLLPVVDNLERALSNSGEKGGVDGIRKGVEMVLGQTLDVLRKEGLEVIDPEGEPFDPEHHEAMMVVETDECPEDTVIQVVQRGYRFNGLLLRPAMVNVSCPAKGA